MDTKEPTPEQQCRLLAELFRSFGNAFALMADACHEAALNLKQQEGKGRPECEVFGDWKEGVC